MKPESVQEALVRRVGAAFLPCPPDSMLGCADGALDGDWPLHGLRHPPAGTTNGWYLWAGEYSTAPDFFAPLHTYHLTESRPEVQPYLGLAPGWRFLLAPGHEDVWYDPQLLQVDSPDEEG